MEKIVGIDLGTTFSAIAILDDLGNPEVLPSIENNNRITRSVVYIGKDKAIVGSKAIDAAITEPNRVVFRAKLEMQNDVVFSTKEGKFIKVDKKKQAGGYTPSQISSLILSKLKGYTSEVKKVIITTPALFAQAARSATLDAAKLAKLDAELINEPTAAVLHYANLPGVKLGGRVLVFDLGGGTFDVTIANVNGKKIDVITSAGDQHLGGEDFDQKIVEIIDKKYQKAKGGNLDKDIKLRQTAEKIKKILSTKSKVEEIIDGPKGPHKIEISREEFEESISTYIEKIKMLMEEALEKAKCKPSNITQTLLVGGSTRVPLMVKIITSVMKKAPIKGVNVDEAVACGAAIYAGLQNQSSLNTAQKKAISQVTLNDVCNFYFGTLAVVENTEKDSADLINAILIPRDTKLPCSKTETFVTIEDGQDRVDCSVTQSAGEETDKDFVNIIKEGELPLPKGRPKGQEIKVTFSYDKSGAMHCKFQDVKSGKNMEFDLRPKELKSTDELSKNLDFKIE